MDASPIKNFIQELTAMLGITVEAIESSSVAAHDMWNIRTPDSKRLIGPQGEHLRALNYVARRIAERNEAMQGSKFLIDVNGYQLGRIRDLEQKARLLADRVRTFRSSAEMTPMNAYERMIIHALFSEDPDVMTESDGFGNTRHVIIKYRTKS